MINVRCEGCIATLELKTTRDYNKRNEIKHWKFEYFSIPGNIPLPYWVIRISGAEGPSKSDLM